MIRQFALLFALAAGPVHALDSSEGQLTVTPIARGLDAPWAFGFLPDGDILITEKDGRVLRLVDGTLSALRGVGPVADVGQGGLLDLLIPADFAESREVYFSLALSQDRGEGTALARARLEEGADRLTDWEVLYQIAAGSSGGRHFGSRLVEGADGMIYMTVGDRGDRPSAQDRSNENGTVLRLTRDGQPAPGNPFADGQPAIWSYGHRNPQGAALDLEGRLWVSEHGARGGDELNLAQPGANYGWPVISYGRHYSGGKIGEGTEKAGMAQPEFYWDPSIAPSGLMIYSGALWPEWRGDIFTGSLKFGHIARVGGAPLALQEVIEGPETARLRDIREAPDGAIWILSAGNGALYRITP
ncbi:PQQ-dependent sugar dehydrogenase [Roseovarius sp. LXJ103]|uniref:PQQ-dependent sugar dehydrogenase n=1 Tax=Roseovarius carneus TaxID=2853164 RepID=UPI000D617900|nr:PQQ-dependent sugar dehydrogenase [Roseovarius carneus]MBZ8119351.1 PQQ-dependent sugar dehydrogenase [Roseovarius carneus]PWE37193.1 hypothetical protein DD563_03060 [Pelagicola sp. LXJ1103]